MEPHLGFRGNLGSPFKEGLLKAWVGGLVVQPLGGGGSEEGRPSIQGRLQMVRVHCPH